MTRTTDDAARLDAEALAALRAATSVWPRRGSATRSRGSGRAPTGWRCWARSCCGSRRPREAARALVEASAAMPDNAPIEVALGVALVQSGEAAAAVAPLEHAVTLAPSNKDAWNALGLARAATGDVDGAGTAFERALAAAPRFTPALVNWCDALVNAGRLAQAIELASAATERHPFDPDAWFTLGNLRMREGDLDAARAAYSRSAALFTGNAATHVNLGLVLQWSGRLAEAEAQFREARRCDPADADARFGLATTLLKLRQSDEGWALYAQGRTGAADWPRRRIPARPWDGEPFAQGALIVDADQGIGDVLQLARFLPRARERVPRLVVYCSSYQAPALPLLATMPGIDAIVGADSGAQAVAATCAMSELPHLLRLGDAAFAPVDRSHAARRRGESLVGARRRVARTQGRYLLGRQPPARVRRGAQASTGAARSPRSASHGSPPSPASASSACKRAPRAATRRHSARPSTTGPTSSPISAKPPD